MENVNSSHLPLCRSQTQTNQLNQNINKLIDDLGQKMQKELVSMEEKILLKYKTSLQQAQQNYRILQQKRNDEVVKDSILTMKCEHQKIYHDESQKALQMNKIYDTLKVDLKRNNNYERELQLEIKFLNKQCQTAKNKSEMLDEEIKQYEERKKERATFKRSEPKLKSIQGKKQPKQQLSNQYESQIERRIKNKIQFLREYLDYISSESTNLEKIFSKYDLESYKTQRQKLALIDTVFQDSQFKKYLYEVLFDCDPSQVNQTLNIQ